MPFERKISGKGTARAGKGFTLYISNKNMNEIIKIKKILEDSGVLIDGVTETVKHGSKKQIYWGFVSFFTRFNSETSDFFNSKRCKWKRS